MVFKIRNSWKGKNAQFIFALFMRDPKTNPLLWKLPSHFAEYIATFREKPYDAQPALAAALPQEKKIDQPGKRLASSQNHIGSWSRLPIPKGIYRAEIKQ